MKFKEDSSLLYIDKDVYHSRNNLYLGKARIHCDGNIEWLEAIQTDNDFRAFVSALRTYFIEEIYPNLDETIRENIKEKVLSRLLSFNNTFNNVFRPHDPSVPEKRDYATPEELQYTSDKLWDTIHNTVTFPDIIFIRYIFNSLRECGDRFRDACKIRLINFKFTTENYTIIMDKRTESNFPYILKFSSFERKRTLS